MNAKEVFLNTLSDSSSTVGKVENTTKKLFNTYDIGKMCYVSDICGNLCNDCKQNGISLKVNPNITLNDSNKSEFTIKHETTLTFNIDNELENTIIICKVYEMTNNTDRHTKMYILQNKQKQ
jgi:hypothetical protein